jgi:hypothetical protein
MDNTPLTYVLTTAKHDATWHRWLADLATYNFNIKYRPWKNNADADGLSRIHTDTNVRQDINQEFIRTICSSPRFLCRLTALIKLLVAVQRQSMLYTENSGFASPTLDQHISTFRGYQILFSIINLI